MNELGNQIGLGIIVAYLLQGLKHSSWFPFLDDANTRRYKVVFGGIAAFAATIGIHYAFDYNATGNGVLTIVLPTWTEFGHAITDFAKQWAFQQGAYDSMVNRQMTVTHQAPSSLPALDAQGHQMTGP